MNVPAESLRGYATINVTGGSVCGLVLLPDVFYLPEGVTFTCHHSGSNFSDNTYTMTQWSIMESAGAVFLPAAGYRKGASVNQVGLYGYYWSSESAGMFESHDLEFSASTLTVDYKERLDGYSVRLIRDIE